VDTNAQRVRERAEAAFKKKEQQLREGQQAMAEYVELAKAGRLCVCRRQRLPSRLLLRRWSRRFQACVACEAARAATRENVRLRALRLARLQRRRRTAWAASRPGGRIRA
jgi:hypothetical protein